MNKFKSSHHIQMNQSIAKPPMIVLEEFLKMNNTQREMYLNEHYLLIVFAQNAPTRDIQSRFISFWSNVDIYYAMNYILSSFCTELNEFAVVILLKQLSVCGGRSGKYWTIIKSVWHMLFQNKIIQSAVFSCNKWIASYSLKTLAVFDSDQWSMMTLFNAAHRNASNQRIEFSTYNAITITFVKDKKCTYSKSAIRKLFNNAINCREMRRSVGDQETQRRVRDWFVNIIKLTDKKNLTKVRNIACACQKKYRKSGRLFD